MKVCTNCTRLWTDRIDVSLIREDRYKKINLQFVEISQSLSKNIASFVYNPECSLHFNSNLQKLTHLPIGSNQIIKSIKEIYSTSEGPHIYQASMDYPHAVFRDAYLNGFGIDFDPELALIKSVAEVIERYVYYLPIQSHFTYGSFQELSHQKITLLDELKMDQETWWCEGINIKTNEPHLLPAQSTGISRLYSSCLESQKYYPRSTGFAIHQSKELAINHGFYEYLERHVIHCLWQNGFKTKINLLSLPESSKFLLNLFKKEGYRVEVVFEKYEETFFICWTFIIFEGKPGRSDPALVTGASCCMDPFQAVLKSLLEAFKELKRAQAIWPVITPQQPINAYDHFLYYLEEKNAHQLVNKIQFENLDKVTLHRGKISVKNPTGLIKNEILGFFIDNILLSSLNWHAARIIIHGLSIINWNRGFYDMPLPFA